MKNGKNEFSPQKIGYLKKLSNEKNQSCSKLPEMARKYVENDFCTTHQPPPTKKRASGKKILSPSCTPPHPNFF